MKTLSTIALLLALAASASALAAEDCADTSTQTAMNDCAGAELAPADAELNGVYREATGRLKGNALAVSRLKAAQRLWIQLRDADLAARYPVAVESDPRVEYGSMYPMLYAQASTELTRARTAYLRKQFLEQGE
ncbi:MAG TPA: lysozyme inhibitor LprI family protein [Pseudoxanthomonas sp.]|nr:lysozyme inhibitor LprI family protein [Pseudoxanthomonas sp.]